MSKLKEEAQNILNEIIKLLPDYFRNINDTIELEECFFMDEAFFYKSTNTNEIRNFNKDFLSILPNENRYTAEDLLTYTLIQSHPIENEYKIDCAGYYDSNRLDFLYSKDKNLPYGRVLAYNAWFLSSIFENPVETYSNYYIKKPPFDNTPMEDLIKLSIEEGKSFEIDNIYRFILLLNSIVSKKSSNNSSIFTEMENIIYDNILKINKNSSVNIDMTIFELNNKLCSNKDFFLEHLTIQENIDLLFMFINHCFYRHGTCYGFQESFFTMRMLFCIFNDLKLHNDLPRLIEIPAETLRLVVLDRDSKELRKRYKEKPFSILPKKYQDYHKRKLYEFNISIKNEEWYELVYKLALDTIEHSDKRIEEIYTLFIKHSKDIHYFYSTFLASLFEKGRIKINKSLYSKNHIEQRNNEFDLINNLLLDFKIFILGIHKINEDEFLQMREVTTFISNNQTQINDLIVLLSKNNNIIENIDEVLMKS